MQLKFSIVLFVLALCSTINGSSITSNEELQSRGLTLSLSGVERKLMRIRRMQEEHQRKLISIDSKLNLLFSKLIHLEHVKIDNNNNDMQPLQELWRNISSGIENHLKQMQANMGLGELRLEDTLKLQAQLLTKQKNVGGETKMELTKEQMTKDSTTTNVNLQHQEYLQPAKSDCFELDDEQQQRIDGVYKFLEPQCNEFQRDFNERYCAFATMGPAWTVIQRRRVDGNLQRESFNRSWDEYRAGFGDLSMDFWFGNEFIHRMVYRDDYELRIELEDHKGIRNWVEYGLFRLDSESYNYQLLIGERNENSTSPDALTFHNQMDFKVYDHNATCDGWWFDRCQESKSNLNGQDIIWGNWHREDSLRASRMLIRPRKINPLYEPTDEMYEEDSTNSNY